MTNPRDHRITHGGASEGGVSGGSGGPGRVGPPPNVDLGAILADPHGVVVRDHRTTGVKHVFVLMMENRSFDHLLGFSGITGTDAETGAHTTINGLTGHESNFLDGQVYPVTKDATDRVANSPGHRFLDVLEQLCGPGANYPSHGPYPGKTNTGFVSSFVKQGTDLATPMRCFDPERLPVLTELAREFVVCDNWFCSMPGPTEPNRMFVHAATSGDFDDSPSSFQIAEALGLPGGGFHYPNGTIFDRLRTAGVQFRIYADDDFPNAAELSGISVVWDINDYDDFADDLNSGSYSAAYTFIEPSYDALFSFDGGNSQHPRGSVAAGEQFIKETYEAIRRSPVWDKSLFILLWDEHGGFYDHVIPPAARASGSIGRNHGFTFDQLGPRVPALLISPLIPRNLIEHRTLDHSAVLATVERIFGLRSLLDRDGLGPDVNNLMTLKTARTDAPMTLAASRTAAPMTLNAAAESASRVWARDRIAHAVARTPDALLAAETDGTIASLLHCAVVQHLQMVTPDDKAATLARAQRLTTHADAVAYLKEVSALVGAERANHRRLIAQVRDASPLAHTGELR